MGTYASTQVAAYLKARFGFSFTDEPILQRMEDHLWEAGRRAQTQRKEVARIGQGLTEDAAYVLQSLEAGDRAPYLPNSRGDFASGVAHCVELEREVQDLIGVHQAALQALRLHLGNVPTLEEHSIALGKVREQEQLLIGKRQEIEELLAAREEWARDETELLRRLDETEKALRVERAQAHGRAAALEDNAADIAARVLDLERRLEAETKAAQDFADERDDAQRDVELGKDREQALERERDIALNRVEELAEALRKANDPGELGR